MRVARSPAPAQRRPLCHAQSSSYHAHLPGSVLARMPATLLQMAAGRAPHLSTIAEPDDGYLMKEQLEYPNFVQPISLAQLDNL
jgi:hypothetical protein